LLLITQSAVNLFKYLGEVELTRFGGDFTVFWETGRLLKAGETEGLYATDQLDIGQPLLYPPTLLPALLPLGSLTYDQAVVGWSLLPLPFYFALLFALSRRTPLAGDEPASRRSGELTLFACVLPFLFANIFTGQTAAFLAVLFMGGIYFWRRSSLLAGICFGLMSVKPHLGLLLPIALIASRQWRTIGVAIITSLLMAAVATLWLGAQIWQDYTHLAGLFADRLLAGVNQFDKLALGPFISFHTLQPFGLFPGVAAIAQLLITITAFIAIWRIFRDAEDERQDLRFGVLTCAALLATPYSMVYDSPLLALALLPLLARAWRSGWRNTAEIIAFAALISMPYAQPLLAPWHVPFSMLALMLFSSVLYSRYRQTA
jgi:hypothetical protein